MVDGCGDREVMEGFCVLGTAAVIFLLAAAFRAMFWAMPFSFLSLEAFSAVNALLFSGIRKIRYRRGPPMYGTEYARRAQKGFLCTFLI